MNRAQLDSRTLEYEIRGAGEPVVLVHGSCIADALGPVLQLYEAGNKTGAVDRFLHAVLGPAYRSVLDRMLPGAFAQAATDAETAFRIELPALEQWRFTQAEAGRIT